MLKNGILKTTTSSPKYLQSNGQVERTIQTLKRILKKAEYENKDPYLALLEYRNTPRADLLYSPAQILISKRLRSKIPCALKLLESCIVDVSDSINAEESHQQFYYNKRSKPLKPLKKGEKVYCKQGNRRDEAIVVDCDAKRRS